MRLGIWSRRLLSCREGGGGLYTDLFYFIRLGLDKEERCCILAGLEALKQVRFADLSLDEAVCWEAVQRFNLTNGTMISFLCADRIPSYCNWSLRLDPIRCLLVDESMSSTYNTLTLSDMAMEWEEG